MVGNKGLIGGKTLKIMRSKCLVCIYLLGGISLSIIDLSADSFLVKLSENSEKFTSQFPRGQQSETQTYSIYYHRNLKKQLKLSISA